MALTGFFANGFCASTSVDAVAAFASMYPLQDAGNLYALNAASFVAPNIVQAQITNMNLAAAGSVTLTYNVPLMTCDPAYIFGTPTLQQIFATPQSSDLVLAWSWGFMVPLMLYLVASNYQALINFFDHREEH